MLAEKRPLRKLRDDDSKLAAAKADRSIFTNAVAAMTKRARGLEAPFAAADAVGAAIDLPFDEGLKKEREGFLKLVSSDQSKAQRYAFFAEREAAKIAGVPEGTKPRNVERVAIIGAGTMGGGIAMSFANAGIPVTLIETGEEQLKRGMGVMQKNYEATAARGGIPADAPAKRMALINGVVGLENVKDADLVIEAVFETMAVKKEVFGKLDQYAKPGAVLASNTSYLNIDEIAKETKRPQDVLGMHFFSPANVMKLCEIVRAREDRAGRAGDRGRRSRARSPRCRPWSASATALSATACWRSAASSRRSCCSKARCRSRSMPSSPSSACRWGRSRWAISPASTSAGARARIAASSRKSPTRSAKPAASARRPARATTNMKAARARRCPIPRSRS